MNEKYTFSEIEKKWQKYWEENNCFKIDEDETKKNSKNFEKTLKQIYIICYNVVNFITPINNRR